MVWVKMTYFHHFFRTIPGVLAIVIVIRIVILCVFVLVLVQHLENLAMGRAGLPQTEQLTRVAVNLTFFGELIS